MRGYTLPEIVVGASMGLLAMLMMTAVLVGGFNFSLGVDAFQARSMQLRVALEKMARQAETSHDLKVYSTRNTYLLGFPIWDDDPGTCVRLESGSETRVYWRDSTTQELRWEVEGGGGSGKLVTGVTEFQARELCHDKVWLHLEVSTASASDVDTVIEGSQAVLLRNRLYFYDFDDEGDEDAVQDLLDAADVPYSWWSPYDCEPDNDPMTIVY